MKKELPPYTSIDDLPLSLSVLDVAAVLNISRTRVYNLLRESDMPRICIGKRIIVPRDRFLAWMDKQILF